MTVVVACCRFIYIYMNTDRAFKRLTYETSKTYRSYLVVRIER